MLCTANPKDFKNVMFDVFFDELLLLPNTDGWASVDELWRHRPCKECVIPLRFVPFSSSISRSRYHCRCRTCNLIVTSSPQKSSNRSFWSTNHIIRSMRWSAGKWSAPASPISHITLGEKFISCAHFCHCARGHVILYADNVYVHCVDWHIRFVPSSRPQYTLRRESQQRCNVELAKVYSVCTSNLASHRVVVAWGVNGYSQFSPSSSSVSLLLLLLLLPLLWRWCHLVWKALSSRRRVITTTLFVVTIRNLLLSPIKICSKRAVSDAR